MDPFHDANTIEEVEQRYRDLDDAGRGRIFYHAANRRKLRIHHDEVNQRRDLREQEARLANNEYEERDEDHRYELYYDVKKINMIHVPLFDTEARDYILQIAEGTFPEHISFNECIARLMRVFDGIVEDILGHLPDHAYARVVIMPLIRDDPDDGALHTPVSTSFQQVRLITPELLISKIEKIAQSKKSFILNNKMKIHVLWTIPPAGNGRKSDCIQIKNKRCVFSVCGFNNNCLAEAIVFGRHLHEKREYLFHIITKQL